MSLVDLVQAACGTLISSAALDAVTTYDRRGTSVKTFGMDAPSARLDGRCAGQLHH